MAEEDDFKIEIDEALVRKLMWEGLRNGLEDLGDAICESAIKNAPVGSGNLQRGISSTTNQGQTVTWTEVKYDKTETVSFEVPQNEVEGKGESDEGISLRIGSYAPYSVFVEYGTDPHKIEPDPERTQIAGKPRTNPHLKFKAGGGDVFAKKVFHPGTAPNPFFRKAIDEYATSDKGHVILAKTMKKALQRGLAAEVAKSKRP